MVSLADLRGVSLSKANARRRQSLQPLKWVQSNHVCVFLFLTVGVWLITVD